jgi:hypothetical protein
MSEFSANLALSYLLASQADKHVTVNDSLRRLDALVHLKVVSRTQSLEPSAPSEGSRYILPTGKTGNAWASMQDQVLAYWRDGVWEAIVPEKGWQAYVNDTNELVIFDGLAWTQSAVRNGLGLGTAATKNVGTSGEAVPLLNGANSWSEAQIFGAGAIQSTQSDSIFCVRTSGSIQSAAIELSADNLSRNWSLVAAGSGLGGDSFLVRDGDWITGNTRLCINANGHILPGSDNSTNLGSASQRFASIFATSGTISTSDARDKTAFKPLPRSVLRAVRSIIAQIGVFQWNDAVAHKGQDQARLHIGVTAQAVRDAFNAQGEDANRWGLFCCDPIDSSFDEAIVYQSAAPDNTKAKASPLADKVKGSPIPKHRLGIRVDQLIWLSLAAMNAQNSLEGRD